ncbi:MAG: 4-hydroxyphenylacetate 3-hydroxylase family protein [Chloroflexi bacterium]|nr:4-hydroxyphenylacetate 3-hydroxylase family protein [Chloroflexota bacterium]
MMTGDEYKESLRHLKTRLYFRGEQIHSVVDHPATRPHVNAVALTYDMAHDPRFKELASASSHLTGKSINRFTYIHHSVDDLIKKVKMLRAMGQQTGTCFQRCVAHDALNALYGVTYEMDQEKGSHYHQRFLAYLQEIQDKDLMAAGSMTDPKGDRSLSPVQQADPDMYLRVVERRKDGIVVRGAKLHQSGAANSHDLIIMPTTALTADEKDYAVSFAVPVDAPGITQVFGRQTNDLRKFGPEMDMGNARYGIVGGETMVVFDDVFVPWDRVFMCGEHEYAYPLVERFATFHRQNYGGCKTGVSDVLIGAVVALVEYHGVAKAAHVRDKITEMVHLAETLYCCSIACSSQGFKTASGAYFPDPLLANVTKQNVTRYIYEIYRLAQDLAGGFIATMPSAEDFKSPEIGAYIEKYFKATADVPTEHRLRIGRLIENMSAGIATVEAMHGAGSPQTQRIMIQRQANLEQKKRLALKLSGIEQA